MSAPKRSWARNTSGLEASAKRRAESTRQRVDDAIATLLRNPSQRINFNTVAATAGVAKAYLYKEPALRDRIDLPRQQQDEARRRLAPATDRTEASTRVLIAAKDRRIRELETRVKQLEGELATCRGELYERF
jgi:Family of unknown function (DUF6262)